MTTAVQGLAMTEPLIITTADGESREARVYPDGAWNCPFCGGANTPACVAGKTWPYPCANPACMAGGRGDPENVAAIRLEQQRREEAASQRAWLAQYYEEQAVKREAGRRQAVEAFAAEVQQHGYCITCWGRSTSWGLFPGHAKVVRHRKPGNCPSVKRRKQR